MSEAAKSAKVSSRTDEDEFLSRVFHDLRTPLTTLKLKIQLARKFARGLSAPPSQLERFEQLLSGAEVDVDRVVAAVDSLASKRRP